MVFKSDFLTDHTLPMNAFHAKSGGTWFLVGQPAHIRGQGST